jgi:predicted regulator of Ras-like GTPase activity (Roadblock/LC7/MglB family)
MTETTDLVITADDLAEWEGALREMLRSSGARCVLLVNRDDGSVLASEGFVDTLDRTSLGALAAGSFASAREIANLVGEEEFSVLFHQGKQQHIHVNLAGERGLLMTLFDDATTVGLVRLCAKKASLRIRLVIPSK